MTATPRPTHAKRFDKITYIDAINLRLAGDGHHRADPVHGKQAAHPGAQPVG
jgi:hypothetical protein